MRPGAEQKMTTTALESMLTLQWLTNKVRMQVIGGKAWFVARDICAAIGLSDGSNVCKQLDADEKGASIVRTLGGDQKMLIVNESGMLNLVMRSRKPRAKAFRKWVTGEVIPTIRRTGGYSVQTQLNLDPPATVSPATLATVVTDWAKGKKEVDDMRQTSKAIFDCVKPVADLVGMGQLFVKNAGDMQMGILSRLLYSLGANFGRNKLFTHLRNPPFEIFMPIDRSRQPKQEFLKKGWFTVHSVPFKKKMPDGSIVQCLDHTPYITARGFKALWPKFQEAFDLWQVPELVALRAYESHLADESK